MGRTLVETQTIRNNTGTSNKEWKYAIERDTISGRYVTGVWWGRIGTAGQGQVIWDDVLTTAQSRMGFKLSAKLNEGYFLVNVVCGENAGWSARNNERAMKQRASDTWVRADTPFGTDRLGDRALKPKRPAPTRTITPPARARADPEPVSFIRKIKLKD